MDYFKGSLYFFEQKTVILPVLDVSKIVMLATSLLLTACGSGGGFVLSDETDHGVNVLTAKENSKPLSRLVREAQGGDLQTVAASIRVSQDSDDTVKQTGFVQNNQVRFQAERIASLVEGVRFIVNNLVVR